MIKPRSPSRQKDNFGVSLLYKILTISLQKLSSLDYLNTNRNLTTDIFFTGVVWRNCYNHLDIVLSTLRSAI